MGSNAVIRIDSENRRPAMRRLLGDLAALERMLKEGRFETGITRIGAEQEIALIDDGWQPAPVATDLMDRLDDERITHELGRFNLEFNCDPIELRGPVLGDLRAQLDELLAKVDEAGDPSGARPILVGILPTLALEDLGRHNIVPKERYLQLDDTIRALRGSAFGLRIKGMDELTLQHESIMLEALNTSFQLHYQVDPDSFCAAFNVAQAVSAPVLAACVNSPVLFGKRLWRETRIAIFQQTVDTRSGSTPHERELLARVRFGEKWCEGSVLELYQEDISRFRQIFGINRDEHPMDEIDAGRAPRLNALQTHNSTVYRWNRPCYGVTGGKPHLRIENRYLPSGPSIVDEVANAALWFGLMRAGPDAFGDLTERLSADDAQSNFVAAARLGLGAHLEWLDGRSVSAPELIRDTLLPIAREGLSMAGVDDADADRCLGVIDQRVELGKTGAQWMLSSVSLMRGMGTRAERLAALTAATFDRQRSGDPVHEWAPARLEECGAWEQNYKTVGQYMNTDLFTVQEDELIDLAASIMEWERVRHVPVEDQDHNLVGLLSYRELLKLVIGGAGSGADQDGSIAVGDVMKRDPVRVTPETSTLEAIELMRANSISCLPVVSPGTSTLIGIVTEHDFMRIAGQLLESSLRASDAPPNEPSSGDPAPGKGSAE